MLDQATVSQAAHALLLGTVGRHLEAQLFALEIHDVEFKLRAGDFLLFNGGDLANAMGGVNHEFANLEGKLLGRCRCGGNGGLGHGCNRCGNGLYGHGYRLCHGRRSRVDRLGVLQMPGHLG